MIKIRIVTTLALSLLALSSHHAVAEGVDRGCLATVSQNYLDAKSVYQTDLAQLIVKHDSSLSALARLNSRVQIAMAKSRHQKIVYLLEADPNRLNTKRGLSRFANFNWSRQETAALSETNKEFSELNSRVEQLQSQSNGHADWSKLRALFKSKIARDAAHADLLATLKARQKEAEKQLEQC